MNKDYPFGWFESIGKSKNNIYHPTSWTNVDKEFICFFDSFCEIVSDSSILLVGTGSTEIQFVDWPRVLKQCGATYIAYIEIFEGYCAKFANREYKIIMGDVREIDKVISKNEFDLIMWFHGPEHIKHKEMPQTFEKIKQVCGKGLVTLCPLGSYYASSCVHGNIYENHLQPDMSVSDFDIVKGVNFFSIGDKNTSDALIIGYWWGV